MKSVIIMASFWADNKIYQQGQIIEEPTEKVISLLESKEKVKGVVAVEEYIAPKEEKAESKKKDKDAEAKAKADAKKKADAEKAEAKKKADAEAKAKKKKKK